MICPICGKNECVTTIELWGSYTVEVRTLACDNCLKTLKNKNNPMEGKNENKQKRYFSYKL